MNLNEETKFYITQYLGAIDPRTLTESEKILIENTEKLTKSLLTQLIDINSKLIKPGRKTKKIQIVLADILDNKYLTYFIKGTESEITLGTVNNTPIDYTRVKYLCDSIAQSIGCEFINKVDLQELHLS